MGRISVNDQAVKSIFDKREYMKIIRAEQNRRPVSIVTPAPELANVMKQKITNILSNECWTGRRCFIIGGGPSLKGFDFSKLQDELTIGINAVYQKFDPTILFGMDKRFFQWACNGLYGKDENQKKEYLNKYKNLTAIKLHLNVEQAEFENVYKINCMGNLGLSISLDNGLYHGENSGYAALNLAYILGCNPIYLLGFDMDNENKCHWHDGHPGQSGTGDMSTFPIAFNHFAGEIKKKTKVINLNKDSRLKCFEFGDMPKITKKPVIVTMSGNNDEVIKKQLQCQGLRYFIGENHIDKQNIISNAMNEYDRDIAWIDNVAAVSTYPKEIFNFKGDFGTFKNHIGNSNELSGLLYFRNNKNGKELLSAWIRHNDLNIALKNWSGNIGYFIRKKESIDIDVYDAGDKIIKNIRHNKKWILVSYYTAGTSYEKEIEKLINSIANRKIDYCIFEKKPLGTWRSNLNHKSHVIMQSLKMFPGKDIVFVDSDAIINEYPAVFDELSDDGMYNLAAAFHVYRQSINPGSLLSGTLWFKNDDMTKKIVERWHNIGMKKENTRHQHCLRLAIEESMLDGEIFFVYRLPIAYTYIFDYNYNKKITPVITHYQASRRLKHEVGNTPLRDSNFTAKQERMVQC